MAEESKIRDAADAAKGILEATPIYQDALQPAAKQLGQALETIGKAVNVALAPIGALIWGYDKIRDWLVPALEARLAATPSDRIITPRPIIAGPAIEALRFAGNEESLRELYANLLATAMDMETAHTAHPAFVEILAQLTPDEALLLSHIATAPVYSLVLLNVRAQVAKGDGQPTYEGGRNILSRFSVLAEEAGCAFPELNTSYLDNLERLGILRLDEYSWWTGDEADTAYTALEHHPRAQSARAQIKGEEDRVEQIDRGLIRITSLGDQFIAACIADRTTVAITPSPGG